MDQKRKNPIVSVIVLTYNNFDNIEANIRSIQNQKYEDLEIIIHDDGSANFPKEKINKLLSKKKLRYGFQVKRNAVNLGTVKNYNRAIDISNGDIIVPLAQDDKFVDEFCISEIVNHFIESDCWLCTGSRIGIETGNRYPGKTDVNLLKSGIKDRILLRMMLGNFISGSTLYIRKSRFAKGWWPLFDEKYLLLEDYPFVFRCLVNRIPIDYIDKSIIFYGEKGVSGTKACISEKLLKDLYAFHYSEIIPALSLIRSKTVKKYIQYRGLKLADELSRRKGHAGNRAKFFLMKNPDLAILGLKIIVMGKLGCDRLGAVYKMEVEAKKLK